MDDPQLPNVTPQAEPRLRAYLQLLRLPNVFTAMADVAMGFLLTHATLQPWPVFAALLGASTALYLAGMVLNDVFDREVDARDRPNRPIPSGRVPLSSAMRLGFGLLGAGVAAGWLGTALAGDVRPGLVATALAAMVLVYDRMLKSTPLAPLAMGGCRLLNVLLGMSASGAAWQSWELIVAAGIGLYIVGVTWFARTEAHVSNRGQLVASTAVMLAGIALVARFPLYDGMAPELPERWYQFWLVIGALVAVRCLRAVFDPRPVIVQMAVKNCILSLIIIDAAAVLVLNDPFWAVVVLSLLAPAMLLGRWLYST